MFESNLANLTAQYQQAYLIYCYKIMRYLSLLAWMEQQQRPPQPKVKPKSASGVKKLAQRSNQEKPTFKSLKHLEKPDVSTIVAMGFPNGAMSAAFRVAFNDFGRGGFSDLVAERAQNPGREGAPTDTEIGVQLLTEVQETVVNLATDVGVGFVDGATPDFIFDPRDYYDPYYEPAYAAGEALGFTFATGGFSGGGAGRTVARRTAYLYQKLSANGGHLKYGITYNLSTRYTKSGLSGGFLKTLSSGNRKDMLYLERRLHNNLPIGSEEGQKFYINKQVNKGLRAPPYGN